MRSFIIVFSFLILFGCGDEQQLEELATTSDTNDSNIILQVYSGESQSTIEQGWCRIIDDQAPRFYDSQSQPVTGGGDVTVETHWDEDFQSWLISLLDVSDALRIRVEIENIIWVQNDGGRCSMHATKSFESVGMMQGGHQDDAYYETFLLYEDGGANPYVFIPETGDVTVTVDLSKRR